MERAKTPNTHVRRWNDMPEIARRKERIHPAAFVVGILMAVAIGRLPELFPQLAFLHLGKVSIVASLVAIIWSKERTNRILDSKIGLLVVLFSVLAVISVAYSIWGSGSLAFVTRDLPRFLSIFLFVYLTSVNLATIRFYAYALSAILVIMVILTLTSQSGARTSISSSYDPNDMALVLLTMSALVICTFQSEKKKVRSVMLALGIAGFTTVLMTGSRGGFLGLSGVAIYLMLSLSKSTSGKLYRIPGPKVLIGAVVVVVILAVAAPQESWERIQTVFEPETDYNTTAERGRIAIWERGMSTFLHRPWGVGVGAYTASDQLYMTAHNSFLQVAVELGILGFWIYVLFYVKIWRVTGQILRNIKGEREPAFKARLARGLRAALIGHTIPGFFLSFGYSRLFFVLLAMAAALELVSDKEIRAE